MAHPGAYRGNKRQKELKRLQKQEEKRQRRQHKIGEGPEGIEDQPEGAEGALLPEGQEASLMETEPAGEAAPNTASSEEPRDAVPAPVPEDDTP